MAAPQVKTVTDLLPADVQLRGQVSEILEDIHPRLADRTTPIPSIFKTGGAQELLQRLTAVESILSAADDYETTLQKLQAQIDEAEHTRDTVLAELFEQIRPIEKSYQQIQLFFENAKGDPKKAQDPIELWVYDTDPGAIKDIHSVTISSVENFVKAQNADFDFRNDICNIVVPGFLPQPVREKFEETAHAYNALLIGDIKDEPTYKAVENQYREGGNYYFLKRAEEKASCDVITVGYLKVRDAHWFEKKIQNADDLYVPPSVTFAGAFVRSDSTGGLAQGPVGTKFGQIKGPAKARIEPLITEMTQLSMKRQLIPIIRDGNGRLCFYGCRSQADDPEGVLKFFTAYRILRSIGKRCTSMMTEVAGTPLTRDFMEQSIEQPIQTMLEKEKQKGNIISYTFSVDKSESKRMMGICDVKVEVRPTGMLETVNLSVEVPKFKPEPGK